ncbi:hypothetical protein [Staphylococcus argenteus]|uniref:hypothetical protein n=1 Tax=Staphylococcus TaxID=1279 RepID=UPI000F835707|nr:hypothetical protein [Staphylococcus argenteus]
MLIFIIGIICLVVAYITSHLVFLTQITTIRRITFFTLSIISMYIAIGSVIYLIRVIGLGG